MLDDTTMDVEDVEGVVIVAGNALNSVVIIEMIIKMLEVV